MPWYAQASRSATGRSGGVPTTSRIRGRTPQPATGAPPRARAPPSAAGVPCLTTTVAAPSARLRRSSPRRAGTGPQAPLSSRWTKPRTTRTPSSNASHGLRSRHCARARELDVARRDPQRRDAGRPTSRGGSPGATRVEQREPDRGLDRRGAEVALDRARGSRASATSWRGVWRSSSSSASVLAALEHREPVARARAGPRCPRGRSARPDVGRRRPAPGAARRRPAGRGRPGSGSACGSGAGRPGRPSSSVALGRPRQLVEDHRAGRRSRSGSRSGR